MRLLVTVSVCLCVASLPAAARRPRTAAPAELKVLVFDYAGASPALPAAFREAGRILARSGVSFTFVACPDSPVATADWTREPPPGSVIIDLLLRSATRRATEAEAFGFAEREAGWKSAWFAAVFYDRVQDLSHTRPIPAGKLLGAVMAHEIGHLLLGGGAHTPYGIMTAHWTSSGLTDLEQGRLVFSNAQGTRIRTNVIQREDKLRELSAALVYLHPRIP